MTYYDTGSKGKGSTSVVVGLTGFSLLLLWMLIVSWYSTGCWPLM